MAAPVSVHGTGGWLLTLVCACPVREEYRAVVGSLAVEAATKAGWKVPGSHLMARPEETRAGMCPVCSAQA